MSRGRRLLFIWNSFPRNRDVEPYGTGKVYDSCWTQTATGWTIAVMMTTGIIDGQLKSDGQVKVLTVCEVLGNVSRYADAAVAVVGRMERSVSLTDHYEFLSQDRCQHPVITHGHVWPDKIQIWTAWEADSRQMRARLSTPIPLQRRMSGLLCTGGLRECRIWTKIVVLEAAVETAYH